MPYYGPPVYGPPGYGHPGYGHPGYGHVLYYGPHGYGHSGYMQPGYGQPVSRFHPPVYGHEQVSTPLQQVVVVENLVQEVSFLKPHDPLPIEALNSIRSIGTGEEEDMYADIENQLNRLLDESN